ncbi:MAG TPA: DsbC family protein [Solimonas sp.]
MNASVLRRLKPFLAVALFASLLSACAPERSADGATPAAPADATEIERVRAQLAKFLPEIQPDDVRPSAVPGLYEVQQGSLFAYVTADGRYLISGDLIDVASGQSLTENRRRADRVARLRDIGEDQSIIFAAAGGVTPANTVTVFTDIDCGYCRKLHREIGDYNAAGVSVRYLFYPRSGPGTDSFRKAEVVWCSSDRREALTRAKMGAPMDGPSDCPNPIMTDYALGQELGLRGTPMMVLPDGEVVNGYVPAAALAERLKQGPQG